MTAQPTRDQLREAAEGHLRFGGGGDDLASGVLALLDQLDQTEAERDAARGYISELETAVQSRNDVIRHRDARIKAVRAIHRDLYESLSGVPYCDECDRAWPCPTIRALDGTVTPPDAG